MEHRQCGRARAALFASGFAAFALTGCATAAPGAVDAQDPGPVGTEPVVLLCQGTEVSALALEARPPATELPSEVVAALESPTVTGLASVSGWFIADEGEDRLVIMHEYDEPVDLGAGDIRTFALMAISTSAGEVPLTSPWGVEISTSCTPSIDLGDLGDVSLTLDPAAPPSAEADQLALLATERSCNSGQPATGRIEIVEVVETETSVELLIGVGPQSDGAQSCPSNPPTPFTVELERPLGDRTILDAGVVPARKLALPS
jgi:hypothetical protein